MAKAMILAAGQGTRVRPLTKYMPKPMIPILGKPVLEYLIEHLARYGVKEIMINVAYSHWKIENYFGNGSRWGVEIGYSFEGKRDHGEIVPNPKGSAGGMRKIQDHSGFFDETTIVLCGDAIIDLDIGAALHEHAQQEGAGQRRHARGAAGGGEELRRGRQRHGRPHHRVPGEAGAGGGQVAHGQHRHLHLRAGRCST